MKTAVQKKMCSNAQWKFSQMRETKISAAAHIKVWLLEHILKCNFIRYRFLGGTGKHSSQKAFKIWKRRICGGERGVGFFFVCGVLGDFWEGRGWWWCYLYIYIYTYIIFFLIHYRTIETNTPLTACLRNTTFTRRKSYNFSVVAKHKNSVYYLQGWEVGQVGG